MIARVAAIAAVLIFAASHAHAQNVTPPSAIGMGQIFGLFAGTLFVLAIIAGAAWLLKRFSPSSFGSGGVLRVVAGAAVGQRERVVVVEIGSTWLVVGVAPGCVNLLQQMPRAEVPESAIGTPHPSTQFATWLKQMMEKRNGH